MRVRVPPLGNMGWYDVLRPALFSLPAETAHDLVRRGLGAAAGTPVESLLRRRYVVRDDRLAVSAFDTEFPNPVGVAAGFDKNGTAVGGLAALGFGFVEVGGVTAEAQPGNPRPRMFRLVADEAIVNRMGLNNEGADRVGRRLRESVDVDVPVGVNLAKSESASTAEAPDDYRYTYERVADGGDFFVVNVSCPNSEDFRDLQNADELAAIFAALVDAGASPLLVKLSPDLPEPAPIASADGTGNPSTWTFRSA
jgi:dihydroorotate dehydrogenase